MFETKLRTKVECNKYLNGVNIIILCGDGG
mgnify:CR=1 FL=1